MKLPGEVDRNLFFTGKGGVGKTSIACATAVSLADAGETRTAGEHRSRLEPRRGARYKLGMHPTRVESVPVLRHECDPEEAAKEYRERVVGPYRGMLPDAAVASIEEQLSGAAPSKSQPSMSSQSCWVTITLPPNSITSFSTPHRLDTHLGCYNFPLPGQDSSRPMSVGLRAWVP